MNYKYNDQGDQEIAVKGSLVGEYYLPSKSRDTPIHENIIMCGDGRLAVLTMEKFFEAIGGDFEQTMEKNINNHEVKYMQKSHKKENYDHLKLEDMILIKKLGCLWQTLLKQVLGSLGLSTL